MIIVAGHLIVVPDMRGDYLEGCRALIVQARSTKGCLDFHLAADPLDDSRINVYERWSDRAELDDFRGSGPDDEQATQILDADVREFFCDRETRL